MAVLPDSLVPEITRLAGEGKTAEDITRWLFDIHKIVISSAAVRKRLAKVRKERAPIVSAVIADKLSRTVGKDLDEVGFAIERALEDELNAREAIHEEAEVAVEVDGKQTTRLVAAHPAGSDTWMRIMTVVSKSRNDLMKLIDVRLKLAGADEGKNKEADAAATREKLLAKVDLLMAQVKTRQPVDAALSAPTSSTMQ